MNQVFNIIPENITAQQTNLFCEAGRQSFSYVFQDTESKIITGLGMYAFEKGEKDISVVLKKIFEKEEVLKKNFNKVCVAYNYDEYSLIPETIYKYENSSSYLEQLFGSRNNTAVQKDHLEDLNVFNIYRVPVEMHRTLITQYPLATFKHYFTYQLKNLPAADALRVHFYQGKIVCMLVQEGNLKLINAYDYVTSEDVVYHLLNICNEYSVADLSPQLSGMIEKDSALYKEIHKYFADITFAQDSCTVTDALKELPAHYFTNLYTIASCG